MMGADVPGKHQFDKADRVTIAVGAVLFLGLCAVFWPFVADDAYIVGRYARNAAAGHGLVYNIGERVSALTSPLHALLEAGLAWSGLDPVAGYRALAPLLVLAGWFAAIRETGINGRRLALFTLVSLFSPFLVLWTVGGLETALLTCLATLFIAWLVVFMRTGLAEGRALIRLGLLAALMFLTRFDSVLVTAPVLLAIALVEYRRPILWVSAAICLVIASSWLVFAANYYGDIFPTSFYVKFIFGGHASLDSLSALLNFLAVSGLFFMAFLARPKALAAPGALSKAILRGGAIGMILFLLYASRASGQHMMFGYRLFLPYLMGVGLVLSLALSRPGRGLVAVFAGCQAVMIAIVAFVGINPAPLAKLPILNRAHVEYQYITPATYGQFMDMLRRDAEAIAAHWRETGLEDEPRIYLRTGGTGYWLPEFHVYETLVSYRPDGTASAAAMINAAHYVQQLGLSATGKMAENTGRARADIGAAAPLHFATTIDWMGPKETGYLFGPNPEADTGPDPAPLRLGRVGAYSGKGEG